MLSRPFPTRKASLCCITWRSYWEAQVTPAYTRNYLKVFPVFDFSGRSLSSEVFMGFVKSYIQLFAYSSATTEDWKNYLFTYFKDKVRRTWINKLTGELFAEKKILLNPSALESAADQLVSNQIQRWSLCLCPRLRSWTRWTGMPGCLLLGCLQSNLSKWVDAHVQ